MTKVEELILGELKQIRERVDRMAENGCAKAIQHERHDRENTELFKRVRSLEESRAEGRGKVALIVAVASTGMTLFTAWVSKKF